MLVQVCSAYSGDIKHNTEMAKLYCRYIISLGYIPFAPHLFFTQFLDEYTERGKGMELSLEMIGHADLLAVFGRPTEGMKQEIEYAKETGVEVRYMDKFQRDYFKG